MSDDPVTVTITAEEYARLTEAPKPAMCESCGEQPMRYVVADTEETDTSLFCGTCIVLTFAKVANDMFASES